MMIFLLRFGCTNNLILVEVSLRIDALMQAKESVTLGHNKDAALSRLINKELLFVIFHEG
jgi:hypothetical protein